MKCPRCGTQHEGEFHGPCEGCREELRFDAAKRAAVRNFMLWMTSLVPRSS